MVFKMNEEKDMELHGADSETVSEKAVLNEVSNDVLCDEIDGVFDGSDDVIQMEGCEDEIVVNDKIFGLKRRTFHLVVIGYALGLVVVGVLGVAGLYSENGSTVIPGAIGAVIGYALSYYLDRRDEAKNAK